MSKLWPHVTLPDPRLAALWPHVGGVKELNGTASLAEAMAAGVPIRILRDTGTDGAGGGDAVNLLLNYDLSVVTHVQISCESTRSGDPTWQRAVIAGLRRSAPHLQIIGFGFPTGNPVQVVHMDHEHFPEWVALAPILGLVDVVGLDEYFGCLVDDPAWNTWLSWTAERHQLVRTCLGKHGIALPPVIILESGLDHVIPGAPNGGWVTRGVGADAYWRTLLAVNTLDEQDPNVLGRCIYTFNATPDWAGYETMSLLPRFITLAEHAMPDYSPAIWKGSPNFWPSTVPKTTLVLHGTASGTSDQDEGVIATFATPQGVAATYCVSRRPDPGRPGYTLVYQFVSEVNAAWGNGILESGADSQFVTNTTNPNRYSISVETMNGPGNLDPLTPTQLYTLLDLIKDIRTRHPILLDSDHIIGHDHIAPESRFDCPGPNFPWPQLYGALGVPTFSGIAKVANIPYIDQNFHGSPTIQCGPTAAAEILQSLGKRPSGLGDEDWVKLVHARVHPGVAWTEYGVLTTPQQVVDGMTGWFSDIQVSLLFSFQDILQALANGKSVEGFIDARQFNVADQFYHFLAIDQVVNGQVHFSDPDRVLDQIPDWVPLTQLQAAEEAAPRGPYGIAFWSTVGGTMLAPAPGFVTEPDGSWRCTVSGCPYTVGQGFLAYYQKMGSLAVFGYPRSDAFGANGGTAQWFQRGRMEWSPATGVQLGLVGDELMKLKGLLK